MRNKVSNLATAVLAGGRNSRMSGFNKAFMCVNGTTVIERTIKILEKIFAEIILVTNSAQDFKIYDQKAIIAADIIKDIGPLGGIHSALSVTSKAAVFFVACDMPFLHNELIRRQLEYFKTKDCDALVPRIKDSLEPLHAIYKKNLADDIRQFVKENSNYSIRSFLKTINVCYWYLEDISFHRDIFKNLNTRDDVNKAEGVIL